MNTPGAAPSPLSPDQTHLDTDPIAHLSPAQRRVLELLSINTPTNIHDLATLTGHHPNTLREHLNALIHLGLVRTTTSKPHGRGRPPTLYQALPLQNARPETRAYHALTTALVNQLLRTSTNPTHDAL
ncbi:ArsR family transcriptional regulator, partial [Dermatophilus congolensis]